MKEFISFSRLKEMFSRLNPLNSFKWDDDSDEIISPLYSKELLEYAVINYSEFKYVIIVAIYHLINTNGKNKEFLTVLTKNFCFIADLIEGDFNEVVIPENVKYKVKKGEVLLTCHNHFYGAIIPSLADFKNAICPKIRFTIIVSEMN